MDIFYRHYWSLVMDFVEGFKDVAYQSVPLPLLYNFLSLFLKDKEIRQEIGKPTFKAHLQNNVIKEKQIQPGFDRFLPLLVNNTTKKKAGKILLYELGLRFPGSVYDECFPIDDTVVISEQNMNIKKSSKFGMPIHYLKDYKKNVQQITTSNTKQAYQILNKYKIHPIFGNDQFQQKFLGQISYITELLAAIENYLELNSISCVMIGTTKDSFSKALAIMAAKKGIPSICIQHGLIQPQRDFPMFSTINAVYGEYEKDSYKQSGVKEERLTIVGHPRFDRIFTESYMPKDIFQSKFGINKDKKTILILTQFDNSPSYWISLINELTKNELIELIIKPHPRELRVGHSLQAYKEICSSFQTVQVVETPIDPYDLISNADIVITKSSTAGLEAMLFGKPVFIFNQAPFSYYEKLGPLVQSNPVKLGTFIKKYIENSAFQREAQHIRSQFLSYAYLSHGQLATKRLSNLISKLIDKG